MVKRLLSISAMLLTVFTASAQYQLLNSDFEQWESVGKGEEPVEWNSFLTATGSLSNMVQAKQLEKSEDAQHGQYSAYIYARDAAMGIPAQGNLTNGCINGGSMSAKDASGNYNYTRTDQNGQNMAFTGRPDAIRVWMKGDTKLTAKIAVRLHANGYYQDPLANESKCVALIGTADGTPKPTSEWQQFEAKFTYKSTTRPAYALVTFATCSSPGDGSTKEYMYVDNIEMVYYSTLNDVYYNNMPVQFDAQGHATIDDDYNPKSLKYTTGAGAEVIKTEPTAENDYTMTIVINGDNISEDPTNTHTYTIKFSGVFVPGMDDESSVEVAVPDFTPVKGESNQYYYVQNVKYSTYLSNDNTLTTEPQCAWKIEGATLNDGNKHYLQVTRTGDWKDYTALNYNNFPITSSDDNLEYTMSFKWDSNTLRMYRNVAAYKRTFIVTYAQNEDIYVGAATATSLHANSATAEEGTWYMYDPLNYLLNTFCNAASSASISNPVSGSLYYIKANGVETISGLPLGIYSLDGGEKFYLSNDSDLPITDQNSTLTYYGRLNLALDATFNGVAIANDDVLDEAYDASKLTVNLSGNGAQQYTTFFDEETYMLTITVKGYGRENEYTVQFAAPDLGLHATWYGEKVVDGQTINEEYNASALVLTCGKGAESAVVTDYNESTGVATIEVSGFGQTQQYTLTFQQSFAAEGDELIFRDRKLFYQLANGEEFDEKYPEIHIQPLTNGNYNVSIVNLWSYNPDGDPVELGNLVAKNVAFDKQGNFCFADSIRPSVSEYGRIPVVINGVLKDGELESSFMVNFRWDETNYVSAHVTYNLGAITNTKQYTHNLSVTVNGEQTVAENQQVTINYLQNGNINFSLQNFGISLNGEPTPVGDIFLENLPVDENGFFNYQNGILISAGYDTNVAWLGPGLGIVPVNLRGQLFEVEGEEDIMITIDITMESLNQVINVYFGDEPASVDTYEDLLVVTINGESTSVENQQVEVANLKNGNINFNLKNFMLMLNGDEAPVGNVSVINLNVDENGDFEYNGVIRVGKGDDENLTWIGPSLGDVPLQLRGQIYDNNGTPSLMAVIDISMESLGQTIHVTYGLGADKIINSQNFTDQLTVTVNGETTTQESTVTVEELVNGKINFTLRNFVLDAADTQMPIGNISIDALTLDENGKFSYNGVIRISDGDLADVEKWSGNELGDVPLELNGQMAGTDNNKYLIVGINIDMEEAIGQTINVTFGGTATDIKQFTDQLDVTVNGEVNTTEATVTVEYLHDEFINFTLKNFAMDIDGQPMYLGNIAVNALEIDENGNFTFNGNIRIGEGDLADVETWAGPGLGAIPMKMKGQIYTYNDVEYLSASIDIDMEEALGQTITVAFGAVPVSSDDFIGNLTVSINKQDINLPRTDVMVGYLRNGNINFVLKNFKLTINDVDTYVGNIQLNNMELDAEGNFSYNGNVRIGEGDKEGVESWFGTELGAVPLVLTGNLNEGKLVVDIDIDMQESLQQTIGVKFGYDIDGNNVVGVKSYNINKQDISEKIEVADVVSVIQSILDQESKYEAEDIEKALDIILLR